MQAEFDNSSDDEIYEPKQHIIINMPQLQVFGISFCKLKVEIVLEFPRFVKHLREIHIHDCDYMLTPDNINSIINIRRKNRNRIDPLLIYVEVIDSFTHEVSHSSTSDNALERNVSHYRSYESRTSKHTLEPNRAASVKSSHFLCFYHSLKSFLSRTVKSITILLINCWNLKRQRIIRFF